MNDDKTANADLLDASETALRRRGLEIEQLLTALKSASLPSLTGWFTIQEIKQSADSVLEDGWKFSRFDPVRVAELTDWAQYGVAHRSWGFHLHAWEFMDPLLRAADASRGMSGCVGSSRSRSTGSGSIVALTMRPIRWPGTTCPSLCAPRD